MTDDEIREAFARAHRARELDIAVQTIVRYLLSLVPDITVEEIADAWEAEAAERAKVKP